MLIVRDSDGKIRCAKCYCKLGKKEVIGDKFLPRGYTGGISSDLNSVGVCKICHKERLKVKFVLPTYWRYLNGEQKSNLEKYMKNVRSSILSEDIDDKIKEGIKKL